MKAGCGTCQYRHECFPAHFVLPPTQAEAAVKSFWTNPKVRSHLPYAMLAASLAGTGWLVWSEHDRLAALLERHLGVHFPLTTTTTTTSPSSETTELDRQRVWDQLSSRPEILNSFLFCSCGCGEKVDFNKGEFELKAGRVFNRAHFRCNGCGKHLEGTTTSSAGAHEHEEDGWVFHKEGKLYCVYDFMDRFCDTCAGCGRTLGDQLAVDPRLGCAFCVDCFQASGDAHKVERHFGIVERVETQSQGDKLMREVKTWLSQEMGIQFAGADGDIPLSLYRPEKIEHLHGSGKKHHRKEQADDQIGSTLGLTVKQVSRVSLFAKKYTPTEVILVKGLSQEHAGAVLAHEMMHCWIALYLSQKTELPEEVEEGLCELMSYLWLVHKNRPAALPAPETKTSAEVEYLLARMERNWANAQGRGFHRAITSLQTHEDGNLRLLLAHARQHANLPAPLPSL